MNRWLVILLIFLFSVLLRLWNLNEIGRTWDEQWYAEQGYKMVELLKKGDFNNSYFYTTYAHPPLVKYLYGIATHFDTEKYLQNGEVVLKYDLTYSRILSAILFSLGVIVVTMIGWKRFSPMVGIMSGIILSMLPFSLGISQLVTVESFKIFIYPLTIYLYLQLIEKFSWKKVLIAGVITGIALQVKQSNFLLVPMLCIMFFFQYRKLKVKEKIGFINTRVKIFFLILLISILTFILIWPQVLFHFKEIYIIHQKFWSVNFSSKIWQITLSPPEIFFGRLMLAPIFYYVVYFFITIPVLILFLFLLGAKQIIKKNNVYSLSILLWFLLPFSLSFYSWRQHGLRYIIEIYPTIALISAIGLEFVARKFTKKTIYQSLFYLFVVIYLFLNIWNIRPYYLDYFNELVGGINTVYKYKLFQIGWWGQGIKEAGMYVITNAPNGSSVGLALSPIHSIPPMPMLNVQKYDNLKEYDYVIVNTYNIIREGFDDSSIRNNYIPIYFVKADEAILVIVYKHK